MYHCACTIHYTRLIKYLISSFSYTYTYTIIGNSYIITYTYERLTVRSAMSVAQLLLLLLLLLIRVAKISLKTMTVARKIQ